MEDRGSRLVKSGRLLCLVFFALPAWADLFAAQAPASWKTDWDATQRAAEKEAKLVIYGPPGADQQKLYTEVFQQAFPKAQGQLHAGAD